MTNQTNLWKLVARHLSNETTEEENKLLKKAQEEDPCLQFSMKMLADFRESTDEPMPDALAKLEKHLERLKNRTNDFT